MHPLQKRYRITVGGLLYVYADFLQAIINVRLAGFGKLIGNKYIIHNTILIEGCEEEFTVLWKDKFKIGIPVIDQQHEELFCRVADFLLVIRLAGPWEEKLPRVKATMNFMQEYVISHFAYEEALQRDINYPHYEEHKKFHTNFTNEIGRYG